MKSTGWVKYTSGRVGRDDVRIRKSGFMRLGDGVLEELGINIGDRVEVAINPELGAIALRRSEDGQGLLVSASGSQGGARKAMISASGTLARIERARGARAVRGTYPACYEDGWCVIYLQWHDHQGKGARNGTTDAQPVAVVARGAADD